MSQAYTGITVVEPGRADRLIGVEAQQAFDAGALHGRCPAGASAAAGDRDDALRIDKVGVAQRAGNG